MLRSPGLLQMPVFCTLGGLNIFRIVAQRAAGSLLCCMLAAGQSWAGFFGCPLAFIHGHGHEHPVTQGRSPDIIYIYHSPISISTVVISCFIQFRTGSCTSPVITRSPQHWPMRWHKDVSLQALRDWADWSISEATDELQLLVRFAMNGSIWRKYGF